MVRYQIVYWRDIPAQVKLRVGRQRLSRPLGNRFQVAIDEAAMRAGKDESDAYLEEWRTGEWQEVEGEPEVVADDVVRELEGQYGRQRLRSIVRNGGLDTP